MKDEGVNDCCAILNGNTRTLEDSRFDQRSKPITHDALRNTRALTASSRKDLPYGRTRSHP